MLFHLLKISSLPSNSTYSSKLSTKGHSSRKSSVVALLGGPSDILPPPFLTEPNTLWVPLCLRKAHPGLQRKIIRAISLTRPARSLGVACDPTLPSEMREFCWGLLGKPWDVTSVFPDGEECGPDCHWPLAYNHFREKPGNEVYSVDSRKDTAWSWMTLGQPIVKPRPPLDIRSCVAIYFLTVKANLKFPITWR